MSFSTFPGRYGCYRHRLCIHLRACGRSVITTKVKAAILNKPTLKSVEINVKAFKGAVQLSGFVSSQAAINKAVDVTRHIAGVKFVKNDMRIK